MVIYTVTTYTGKGLLAGTTSRIYIQLRGTEAESEEQNLNRIQGFWQGSVSSPNQTNSKEFWSEKHQSE